MSKSRQKNEVSAAVESITRRKGLTQSALAEILGVDQAMVSRYLRGTMQPGSVTCLVLAGLSEDAEERQFWINLSGLRSETLNMILSALSSQRTGFALGGDDLNLLCWIHSKQEGLDKALQDAIKFRVEEKADFVKVPPAADKAWTAIFEQFFQGTHAKKREAIRDMITVDTSDNVSPASRKKGKRKDPFNDPR